MAEHEDGNIAMSRNDGEDDPNSYGLDSWVVARIISAADDGNKAALLNELDQFHPADIADLLEQINPNERRSLIRLIGEDFDGDILAELDEGIRLDVINLLQPETLAEAVRDLDSDDVVDIVEDLEDHHQEAILDVLDEHDRAVVEQSLTFPEYSAGRLMQREVVMAPEYWTVGEAIDYMREQDDLPGQFYHMVIVNPRLHPLGNVPLGRLMSSKRDVFLKSLVEETFHVIPVDQDEGDVAYAFNQYHLISAPVVDQSGRLVGVITMDDAMAVLDEEHEEDMLRLGGVSEDGSLADKAVDTARRRFPWLAVNLATAILASLVIAQFEDAIGKIVALAVLMPIVASMGGNAGTQSLTVAVRSIATKDLTGSNVWRFIGREALVGFANGLVFAVIMGVVGYIWFGGLELGLVLAAAMVINMLIAGLAGTIIPVLLGRVGVDPALASGAFVTTVTDVIGFLAFLGLAAVVLL